jgi:hypothetical protein
VQFDAAITSERPPKLRIISLGFATECMYEQQYGELEHDHSAAKG